MSIRDFAQRVALVLLLAAVAIFLWRIRSIVLVAFGTILAALMIDALTALTCRYVRVSRGWGLFATTTVVLLLLAGFALLFGAQVAAEIENVAQALPTTLASAQTWLHGREWGQVLLHYLQTAGIAGNGKEAAGFVVRLMEGTLASIANILIVVFGAIYLAAQPHLYINGLLDLLPPARRARTARVANTIADALRRWLLGQLVAMILVAALTGIGLTLLGVSSPLALALIAGVAEFVPIVGPILAVVPALLIAAPEGPALAFYVALLYLVVQQVESYLITPLVQQVVVHVPPAIVLFSILAFGTAFGALGLLLATPLAVTILVGVKALYIDDLSLKPTQQRAG